MTDIVLICNIALNRIGARSNIDSLEEVSTEAYNCKLMFDEARDATLRAHDWNFARRRVSLANLGSGPSGWANVYAYPTDAVRVRGVVEPGCVWPFLGSPPLFEIAGSTDLSGSDRREIYSNLSPAEAIYTRRVADVSQWDPLFVTALTWQLGMELAMPITVDPSKVSMCLNAFNTSIELARAQDANEHGAEHQQQATWLRARGGLDDYKNRGVTVCP